jgi:hypothetical protein
MRTVLYAPYVPPGKYARTCTGNVTPTMNRTSITRYLVASTVLYVQTITVTLQYLVHDICSRFNDDDNIDNCFYHETVVLSSSFWSYRVLCVMSRRCTKADHSRAFFKPSPDSSS